jgi:magnesium transporter
LDILPGSGAPVFRGTQQVEHPVVSMIHYDEDEAKTIAIDSVNDFPQLQLHTLAALGAEEGNGVTWINFTGLHDAKLIQQFGNLLEMHPLIIEDILDPNQRPKIELHSNFAFIVVKVLAQGDDSAHPEVLQLSLILGDSFVISFQERETTIFDHLIARINSNTGRVRKSGADYLLYCLLDAIVDHYSTFSEQIGETLDEIEERLMRKVSGADVGRIHRLRQEILILRRNVRPFRYIINELRHDELPQIKEDIGIYLRDLHDHVIQIIETEEIYRDMVTGMLDIYLSSVNNEMSRVMQFLAVFGAIFMPLTTITGIYGMNFDYMPELKWHYGYFTVLGIMATIAVSMLIFFWRRNWIFAKRSLFKSCHTDEWE